MRKKILHKYFVVCISLVILLLMGCSDAENIVANYGDTVIINPSSYDVGNGGSLRTDTTYFTITVIDENGVPRNGVDIAIYFTIAAPATSAPVQFYDGITAVDSPFTATTDEGGNYVLRFDFQSGAGWNYEGDLTVTSGSTSAMSTITITSS